MEGTSAPDTDVIILNGDEEAATTTADSQGKFAADVSLQEGENVLTAKASTEQGQTGASEPVTIILDRLVQHLLFTR